MLSWKCGSFKLRKAVKRDDGYFCIALRSSGKTFSMLLHRVILEVFCGKCPEGEEARHLDGVKEHNFITNLLWGTRLENAHDRQIHGTARGGILRGEDNKNSRLTPDKVLQIRSSKMPSRALAKMIGVSASTVKRVRRGQVWSHIKEAA